MFGGDFCAVCTLCTFSDNYLRPGYWVATYWEIATHSANDLFSLYMYLYMIVNLAFPSSVFGVELSF